MLKKILCILLILLFLPVAGMADQKNTSTSPVVRVWLKRPGIRDTVTLLLGSTYLIQTASGAEMVLPAGTEVTLIARENQIYLHYEAMNLIAGKNVKMIRSATSEGKNGTAYEGVQLTAGGNIYPGDLVFDVDGGYIRAILHVNLDHYLLGVVPYEMNDNFPLEALKAQTVCARTYALKHMDASRAYDVVDTTENQVFGGVNILNLNASRAVCETAGVVGKVNGKYASCYYTASNGGQTELPTTVWGASSDDGSYEMRDDPYDVANPESVIHRYAIAKDGSDFPEILLEKLMFALPKVKGSEMIQIDSVDSVLPIYEKNNGNRFANGLQIQLTWRITAEGKEDTTSTITAQVPLFPEIMDVMELSITDTNRELVTVKETDEAFVLESRRFGHGVGLSQRGAQWMAAQEDMDYTEILAFYYPKMKLEQMDVGAAVLPTVPAELAATPGPTASPTPRPTLMPVTTPEVADGGYLVSVEKIEDDSSLNLRDKPTSDGTILMRLYKHQQLWVLEEVDSDWVHVKTDSVDGYVMGKFLEKVE